jgi:hypothetical protein
MLTIDTGILVVLSQGVGPVQFLGGRFTMRLPSRGRCRGGGILRERIERDGFDRGRVEPLPLGALRGAIPRRMNARRPVASFYLAQLRHHLLTLCGCHPAAGMEHASSWRIQRAGHLSREGYALSLSVY